MRRLVWRLSRATTFFSPGIYACHLENCLGRHWYTKLQALVYGLAEQGCALDAFRLQWKLDSGAANSGGHTVKSGPATDKLMLNAACPCSGP
jgi:hypothetical protein